MRRGDERKNGLVVTEDLRPLFTERSTAHVHPGLAMHRLDDVPRLTLDSDAIVRFRAALNTALVRGQAVLVATHLHHELDQDATRRYVLDDAALREI